MCAPLQALAILDGRRGYAPQREELLAHEHSVPCTASVICRPGGRLRTYSVGRGICIRDSSEAASGAGMRSGAADVHGGGRGYLCLMCDWASRPGDRAELDLCACGERTAARHCLEFASRPSARAARSRATARSVARPRITGRASAIPLLKTSRC